MLSSFLLILLALAAWGALHSWLASLPVKAWVERALGKPAVRAYRLFYNGAAFVTLLPVLALARLLPDARLYAIPWPWLAVTVLLQALAVGVLLVGVKQTGAGAFLGVEQLWEEGSQAVPRLVDGGLYRWVRHPLYTAGLVFIWLAPVMTANLLAFNLGLTAYILVGIRFEERKLLREFGEQYATYRGRTPMLIPGPKNSRRGP